MPKHYSAEFFLIFVVISGLLIGCGKEHNLPAEGEKQVQIFFDTGLEELQEPEKLDITLQTDSFGMTTAENGEVIIHNQKGIVGTCQILDIPTYNELMFAYIYEQTSPEVGEIYVKEIFAEKQNLVYSLYEKRDGSFEILAFINDSNSAVLIKDLASKEQAQALFSELQIKRDYDLMQMEKEKEDAKDLAEEMAKQSQKELQSISGNNTQK